jgi:hypothetical protein
MRDLLHFSEEVMALLSPEWNTIKKLRQKPTEGEIYLLKFLDTNLDDG